MGRCRFDEWGISFAVHIAADGYRWTESLPVHGSRTTGKVLMPTSSQTEHGASVIVHSTNVVKTRYGLEPVRNAYRAFVKLARELTARSPEEIEVTGVDGVRLRFRPPLADDAEAERLVVDYANRFGLLWGDGDPRPLKDWRREAAEFLTTKELADALKHGTTARLSNRFVMHGERLVYLTGYWEMTFFPVTGDLDLVEDRASVNALPVRTDRAATIRASSVHDRVQATLARQLGRKLDGGTSILFTPTNIDAASVAPRHLIHAVYLRMWRELVRGQAEERTRTCKSCGGEITEGTARRQYCSDQCRWEFNNRRQAAHG